MAGFFKYNVRVSLKSEFNTFISMVFIKLGFVCFICFAFISLLFLVAFPSVLFLPSFVFIKSCLPLYFKIYVLLVWISSFTCLLVVNIRFLISLLINNLHTLNFIHLMCTTQRFFYIFKVNATIIPHDLIVNIFYHHTHKNTLIPTAIYLSPFLALGNQLIYLFLCIFAYSEYWI